jgi:ABC-2 type transport system permease protein
LNTQSNTMSESFETQKTADAVISPTRPFLWSVRRELWEYRSIYLVPLAVAGVGLFGFLIATIGRALATPDLVSRRAILEEPPAFAALLIMASAFIVTVFYCLDTLYSERRDRSILFWKSLPVSDLTTVLAKASIPLVIIPLITCAITLAMQFIMLLLSTVALVGNGFSAGPLWIHSFHESLMLIYHLIAVHGLWYAPIYCWLLLVSAWAKRAAFLWATVPLLAFGVFERIVFQTTHFAHLIGYRLSGGAEGGALSAGHMDANPLSMISPIQFLFSPGMLIGLAIAAAFLFAAVRLRQYREPI